MPDVNISEHFSISITNTMEMMLESDVNIAVPEYIEPNTSGYDVTGVIGLAGDIQGVALVGMDLLTAKKIATKLIDADENEFDEDKNNSELADAIGEFSNIIIGGAKSRLGKTVSITYPCIVISENHVAHRPTHIPTLKLTCQSEYGSFSIEYTIQQVGSQSANAA